MVHGSGRYAYRAKSIKNKPRINEDPKVPKNSWVEHILNLGCASQVYHSCSGKLSDLSFHIVLVSTIPPSYRIAFTGRVRMP